MITTGYGSDRYSFGLGAEKPWWDVAMEQAAVEVVAPAAPTPSGLPASRTMQREVPRPAPSKVPWGTLALLGVAGLFLFAPPRKKQSRRRRKR